MTETQNRFYFREAFEKEEDFQIYLRIKSDAEAVAYSGFSAPPDPLKFRTVYDRIMNDKQQHLLFLCDQENEDTVAATFHYCEKDKVTVVGLGYNVFQEYRGLSLVGLMMRLVNEKCAHEGFKYRLSYVAESNIPSIRNLEKSGAHPTGVFEYRELAALGRKEKYLEYIKELSLNQ